jgi:hypothetical protein
VDTRLTVEDAKQSLNAHVAAKGAEIREKYGPHIGWHKLTQILNDRSCVRTFVILIRIRHERFSTAKAGLKR